jgi:hypothetical protein
VASQTAAALAGPLDRLREEQATAFADLAEGLSHLERKGLDRTSLETGLAKAVAAVEQTVAPVAENLARLQERAETAPDPAVLQKSIRNFWLAIEDSLRRLGEVAAQLENGADGTSDAAALRDLETRLKGIDARLVALDRAPAADGDQGMGEVRLLLAELLASQARLASFGEGPSGSLGLPR